MKGRIRNIKPELGKHWLLWRLGELTGFRLAEWYALLWCYTDRRGRFVWNPSRLKAEIAPYDTVNFEHVLNVLANGAFVVKYRVGVRVYGWIPRFPDHQHFNGREDDSVLPPPPASAQAAYENAWQSAEAAAFDSVAAVIAEPLCVADEQNEGNFTDDSDLDTRGAHVGHVHPIPSHPVQGSGDSEKQNGTREKNGNGTSSSRAVTRRAAVAVTGKMTPAKVLEAIGGVFAELSEATDKRLAVDDERALKAQMCFLYWVAKFKHFGAIATPERMRRIVARLKENGDDVGEILYALDGGFRDDWLMGRDPRSNGKKWDGLDTLLRDREQVEKLSRAMPAFLKGKPHPLLPKLEAALRGVDADGANVADVADEIDRGHQ